MMELNENKQANIVRIDINKMEQYCLKKEQVECPVYHLFGPGIYIREVHIPAGTFAIGHHQKYEHVNIILKGQVTMLNENGTTSELQAPFFYIGKPGRKMGYIHEDIVWQNIYATDERDIEKLEAHYLDKSEYWIDNKILYDKANWLQHENDRNDYNNVLIEIGMPEYIVRQQTEDESDQIDIPIDNYKIKISDSFIEGKGLFATANIEKDEVIAPARIGEKRTFAGRFTNHSINPNAKMVKCLNGDIDLVAMSHIVGCRGGYDGDEITINYRQAIALVREALCQQ